MKYLQLFLAVISAFSVCSCTANNTSAVDTGKIESEVTKNDSIAVTPCCSELINTVYNEFVFAPEANPTVYSHPEKFFTAKALKKLKDSYDFDCENNDCYAFYELRTQQQDSKPGTAGELRIISIENAGDGRYVVKYSDMGWSGITRIKIADGKIDDFERCVEDL